MRCLRRSVTIRCGAAKGSDGGMYVQRSSRRRWCDPVAPNRQPATKNTGRRAARLGRPCPTARPVGLPNLNPRHRHRQRRVRPACNSRPLDSATRRSS